MGLFDIFKKKNVELEQTNALLSLNKKKVFQTSTQDVLKNFFTNDQDLCRKQCSI